jgi:predicted PurR-regulated permease PerM
LPTWGWFLSACAAVAAIVGAGTAIGKVIKPIQELFKHVNNVREDIGKIEAEIKAMEESIHARKRDANSQIEVMKTLESRVEQIDLSYSATRSDTQSLMVAVLALLDHGITGNSVDALKEAKLTIREKLI